MENAMEPPEAAIVEEAGDAVRYAAAPACVTVTVNERLELAVLLKVTTALREDVELLADTFRGSE
jgi:hypothetical protein